MPCIGAGRGLAQQIAKHRITAVCIWNCVSVLTSVPAAQRNHEAQRSVYMKLHRAFFAWNQQHSRALASRERPPPAFWLKVVEELRLTAVQEQKILELREGVLSWLLKSQELRTQAYDQLGRETIMMAVVCSHVFLSVPGVC